VVCGAHSRPAKPRRIQKEPSTNPWRALLGVYHHGLSADTSVHSPGDRA
jgi:hypothetical protein